MGLPVTVYRYTDAGAPQLTNGTPSEWIDILKKVLVEGYGSKTPLGWTLEFENAGQYKVAFRNKVADGGTGGYVQFWSSTGSNAANIGINFQSAADMTALDAFIKPGWGRQLSLANGYRGWEIIGTSRGFYIITHYTTNLLMAVANAAIACQNYFIGDLDSSIMYDAGAFTIVSGTPTQADIYTSASTGIVASSNNAYCKLYGADGSNESYFYTLTKPYLPLNNTQDGNAESLGVNHLMSPLIVAGSTVALDSNGVTQNSSMKLPYCRGVAPGLHQSSFSGYRTENWPKELMFDEVIWVLLRSYYYIGIWIKTSTWYD